MSKQGKSMAAIERRDGESEGERGEGETQELGRA